MTELMKDHGGFDHNRQSFRLVTKLEQRFADFEGLNLSWEVLEGIVKHETEYDQADAGQFDPELRGHLEAQITNVANELAYTAHDLDDGLHADMITPEMLAGNELWEIILDEVGFRNCTIDELKRHEIIRHLIGVLVTDQINSTFGRLQENNIHNVEGLQRLSFNVTGYSEDTLRRSRQIKDFLFKNLYRHYRVVRMEVKACRILTELSKTYLATPSILPDHIQNKVGKDGLERTVCDYLAGMTDRFAIDEYNRLFDPNTLP